MKYRGNENKKKHSKLKNTENVNEDRKLFGTLPFTPAMITKKSFIFSVSLCRHFAPVFCNLIVMSCRSVIIVMTIVYKPPCYVNYRDCV
jgi:hypothetical protein